MSIFLANILWKVPTILSHRVSLNTGKIEYLNFLITYFHVYVWFMKIKFYFINSMSLFTTYMVWKPYVS